MRKLQLIIALFVSLNTIAQDYNLPYRIGKHFGVANPKGEIIIEPKFDMIEPVFSRDNQKRDSFFVAYNLDDTQNRTSFIINNKVVLKNKPYSDYFVDNQLIYTIEYIMTGTKDEYGRTYTERNYLYTYDGKSLFEDEYIHLDTINIIEGNYEGEEILIFTKNLNGDYALHLYNKSLQKITKTYFKNSNYIKHSEYDNYNEISFIYRDSDGQTRKLRLTLTKDLKIIISSNKLIKVKQTNDYYYDDLSVEMPPIEKETVHKLDLKDSISLKLKSVEIKRYSYLLPKQKETLVYGTKTLDLDFSYLVIKNKKIGVKKGRDNSIMIPILYDDIQYGDFGGRYNGFILKKNNRYGLYIFNYPKSILIEPIFANTPILSSMNYPNKGQCLIKIFDTNGVFFCYANQKGELYYSEK